MVVSQFDSAAGNYSLLKFNIMTKGMELKCKIAALYLNSLANRKTTDFRDSGIKFMNDCAIVDTGWMDSNCFRNLMGCCKIHGFDVEIEESQVILSLPFENVVFKFFKNIKNFGLKAKHTLDSSKPSTIYFDANSDDFDDFNLHNAMPYPATRSFKGGQMVYSLLKSML